MEPEFNPGQFTGFHHRPPTTADGMFNQRSVGAFIVPAVGYGVMAVFSPNQLGVAVWAGIALFALPAACGLLIHSIGDVVATGRRMRRAAILAFICFFIYGVVNMSLIHDRIHSTTAGMGALPAMLVAAGGYGLVVAAVSALMASLPVHHVESHR